MDRKTRDLIVRELHYRGFGAVEFTTFVAATLDDEVYWAVWDLDALKECLAQ